MRLACLIPVNGILFPFMFHDGTFAPRQRGKRLFRQGKRLLCKPGDGVAHVTRKVFHARQQLEARRVIYAFLRLLLSGDHGCNALRRDHRVRNAPLVEPRCHIPIRRIRAVAADIRHLIRRAAVLGGPLGNEPAFGIEPARSRKQLTVFPAHAVFAAAHIVCRKDQHILIPEARAAQGQAALLHIEIHAGDRLNAAERNGKRPLLAHAEEIITRDIHDRVMAGKNNMLRLHCALRRQNPHVFHACYAGLFKNTHALLLHLCGKPARKRQRIKPRLIRKAERPIYRKRQLRDLGKHRIDAKALCRVRLLAQFRHPFPRIQISRATHEIAFDPLFFNEIRVFLHRRAVQLCIFLCLIAPERVDQLRVDQPVLRRHLARRSARCSAADRVRLKDTGFHAAFLQPVCREHAGQPAADDRHLRLQFSFKARARRPAFTLFLPDRCHAIPPGFFLPV